MKALPANKDIENNDLALDKSSLIVNEVINKEIAVNGNEAKINDNLDNIPAA